MVTAPNLVNPLPTSTAGYLLIGVSSTYHYRQRGHVKELVWVKGVFLCLHSAGLLCPVSSIQEQSYYRSIPFVKNYFTFFFQPLKLSPVELRLVWDGAEHVNHTLPS